jgi:hypothetical protein
MEEADPAHFRHLLRIGEWRREDGERKGEHEPDAAGLHERVLQKTRAPYRGAEEVLTPR